MSETQQSQTPTEETIVIKRIANEVHQFLQDAVGDIASDMLSPYSGFLDDIWKKKIAKAKKNGVRDILGWLADSLYNDADTLQDLMGDRIFDGVSNIASYKSAGGEHNRLYNLVLDDLNRNAYPGMKKAIKALRR